MDELFELTMEIERLRGERDSYLKRCVVLEDELSKVKKILELAGLTISEGG